MQHPCHAERDQDVADAEHAAERPGGREEEDIAEKPEPRTDQGGRVLEAARVYRQSRSLQSGRRKIIATEAPILPCERCEGFLLI
jgi:hypothetical protein